VLSLSVRLDPKLGSRLPCEDVPPSDPQFVAFLDAALEVLSLS